MQELDYTWQYGHNPHGARYIVRLSGADLTHVREQGLHERGGVSARWSENELELISGGEDAVDSLRDVVDGLCRQWPGLTVECLPPVLDDGTALVRRVGYWMDPRLVDGWAERRHAFAARIARVLGEALVGAPTEVMDDDTLLLRVPLADDELMLMLGPTMLDDWEATSDIDLIADLLDDFDD